MNIYYPQPMLIKISVTGSAYSQDTVRVGTWDWRQKGVENDAVCLLPECKQV